MEGSFEEFEGYTEMASTMEQVVDPMESAKKYRESIRLPSFGDSFVSD